MSIAAEGTTFDNAFEGQERLSGNQWLVVAASALGAMLEFLDNYIISFVLSFIIGPWGLKGNQTALVLLASGMGALLGSILWGHLSDHIGRKAAFVATIATCSLASLALAATPEGDWMVLAGLRFVVGIGVGAFFLPMMLVQEFLPSKRRGRACGIVSAAASSGLLLGALSGSFLGPLLGWRGMFLVGGGLPIVIGIAVQFFVPESPLWLAAKGRTEAAGRALKWALPRGAPVPSLPLVGREAPKLLWREVLHYPRTTLVGVLANLGVVTGYYGMTMWSPTLIAQVQGISGPQAAKFMIGISVAGLSSRFIVGALSDRFGRRLCGAVTAPLSAVALIFAGLIGHGDLLQKSDFWLALGLAFVFADSSFAVLSTYTAEIWPTHVRGRGSGVCYAASGIGKMLGPLGFALFIGSSNVIKPLATVNAMVLSFTFLAAMFLLAALAYVFVKPENQGSSPTMESVPADPPAPVGSAQPHLTRHF